MLKKKNVKKYLIISIILLILLFNSSKIMKKNNINNNNEIVEVNEENLTKEIQEHYNKYVITEKETIIYDKAKNVIGKIGKNVVLILKDKKNIISNDVYFALEEFEDIYVNYLSVKKTDEVKKDDRYKNYIPFNLNIKSNKTKIYDINENLLYEINKEIDAPILVKENNLYGIEYNDELLYVKKDEVEVYDNYNTDKKNISGIPVFNYHSFYDENSSEERKDCITAICHSKKQFKEHLDYIKDNNILTLKMHEFELYMDGNINLPKSILLTIDDGGKTEHAYKLLEEYQMYATIFLITSWYDLDTYPKSEYIEFHSHTDNLHDGGKCQGGQGSGMKCLSEDILQEDLKKSREKLNGSTIFCFPFYEYNDYAIKMVKEAGFTMAFAGEYGDAIAHPGENKFKIKRFVIVDYTTMEDIEKLYKKIY